jgi:ribosomal protein S18 acetylase RimI-like enzyme
LKIKDSKFKIRDQQFVIRPAKTSDLPAIVRMSNGVKEIENYPDQKMKTDDFVHFISGDGALMLVAVAKNKVVGYITVYQSENYFYLPYAVTKKEWRGKGVGSALLERIETLAKEAGVEYILMTVYVYNSSVHKFLKVRGYTPSKKLVQYSKIVKSKGKK